ncbi:MAG: enoyl-CoA hydratase/isomerase family protein [Desulfobacterales bacterium]|jgi:enoyl-CoA hydratase/carnithine racemase|nr:enoyl-CoA hydratase/isomerase family protein [Desulfobacterales bacterium]
MKEIPVIFETIRAVNGKCIGVMTLNVEKKLNSLTLEMVLTLRRQLAQWIADKAIACILVKGTGDRAFCAGGDVQALYRSAMETPGGPCAYAEAFFEHEYRMDYLFHVCPKPVIAWGHGIVMGGGLGILAGCSHRVVTEKARLAMPEVTIALYPDVGAGWFFNKMPGNVGMFLAMTGASFNAADALSAGIADYFITHDQLDAVMKALRLQSWSETTLMNHEILGGLLNKVSQRAHVALPKGNIEAHQDELNALCSDADVVAVFKAITAIETEDNWLAVARDNLIHGSPLSSRIIHGHMQRTRLFSLKEVFQSELVLSTNLVRYSEFSEGVRALLIQKDKNPNWKFATIQEVPEQLLDQLVTPPWPNNPLADL